MSQRGKFVGYQGLGISEACRQEGQFLQDTSRYCRHSAGMANSTRATPRTEWRPRLARADDIAGLEQLIPCSVRGLQADHYSPAQMDSALGTVFGVDRQLIRDGTFFVVEESGEIVGCGGWSRRRSLFGGDISRAAPDPELDPRHDAARLRAFFVNPTSARRGIGRSLVAACERALGEAGFQAVELVATLAGESLLASCGYLPVDRYEIAMAGGLCLPVVRMAKRYGATTP